MGVSFHINATPSVSPAEGKELTKLSRDQLRKIRGNEMSMIFQEPLTSLNPLHTIGKQIGEALLLHTDMNKELNEWLVHHGPATQPVVLDEKMLVSSVKR
jgi:ABC-type microcin C transport system duplicated ATPase subunit YejF